MTALSSSSKDIPSAGIGRTMEMESDLPSFPLSPVTLLHPAHKRRGRGLAGSQNHELSYQHNPDVGAVYAGLDYIPVPESHNGDGVDHTHLQNIHDHNELIRQFQERRHCSRFEHARRAQANAASTSKLTFRELYSSDEDEDSSDEDDDDESPDEEADDDDDEFLMAQDKQGSSLDAYQTAPLSQGVGTHYATVWVGTPQPQPQTLIVDTGSHHTAFPCKPCVKCGEQHHTDEYFDPAQSHTFEKLTCGYCTEDVNERCSPKRECKLSQSYAEGSSWSAYQASDMFFCGYNHVKEIEISHSKKNKNKGVDEEIYSDVNPKHTYDLKKLDQRYALPFIFGCQNHLTGLFVTQLADGIMGMSARETTLPKQMYNAGKLEHNMFSMCFRRMGKSEKDGVTAGVLTLGGVDKRLQRSPMVYAALDTESNNGWYTVQVKKIWLRKGGGQSAKSDGPFKRTDHVIVSANSKKLNDGDGIIIDSGTTDTYFQRHLKVPFQKAFKDMTGIRLSNKSLKLTPEEVLALPTILIQLTAHEYSKTFDADVNDVVGLAGTNLSKMPKDIIFAMPATHYLEFKGNGVYTPRIYFSESSGGVLGANAMMNHDVLFDWENNRIGLAESTCDYDVLVESEKIVDEGDMGDGVSKNCVLGEPRLWKPCAESVDTSKCTESNGDEVLNGVDQYELVVEDEGFGDGQKCQDVALAKLTVDESVSGSAKCSGEGTCDVLMVCSLTCDEALTKLAAVDGGDDDDDSVNATDTSGATRDPNAGKNHTGNGLPCHTDGWGSCQDTCFQSKIISKRRHDGHCYFHHALKRKCHIDNCGRNDPCMVPFVVHAILLFADADPNLWSEDDEEDLVKSFASTVNIERMDGDKLFGPGDVKILSAGHWSADDFYKGAAKTGMQVVLEVSIYNDKAVLPKKEDGNQMKQLISGHQHATCTDSDVYALSQNALDVHKEMGRDNFMRVLIQEIRDNAGHDTLVLRNSVFAPITDEGESTDNSQVLSSWSIKTEVNSILDGGFEVLNKETLKQNIGVEVVIFLVLLLVCYCGSCYGSFCTRRRYRLEQAKRALVARAENMRREKERGQYATIDGGTQVDDSEGEIELGGADNFQDDPIESAEDLDFEEDIDQKMGRLK